MASQPTDPTVYKHKHQWIERTGYSWGVWIRYTYCYICGKVIRSGDPTAFELLWQEIDRHTFGSSYDDYQFGWTSDCTCGKQWHQARVLEPAGCEVRKRLLAILVALPAAAVGAVREHEDRKAHQSE